MSAADHSGNSPSLQPCHSNIAFAINYEKPGVNYSRHFSTLLVFILLFCSSSITAATYYIAPHGSDESGTGTIRNPWKSIYKACKSVKRPGSVIHIMTGTYTENSSCNLAVGVSLEGEGEFTVVKSHYKGRIEDPEDSFIKIASNYAVNGNQHIRNLNIDGDNLTGYRAIAVINRSKVSIYSCTISNFYRDGVIFKNVSGGVQTGNSFHDNKIFNCAGALNGNEGRGSGLGLNDNEGLLVYNNTINQQYRRGNLNGVAVSIGDSILGLQLYNNTILAFAHSTTEHPNFCFAVEFWSNNKKGGPNSAAIGGWGTAIYKNTFEGELDIAFGGDKAGYEYSYDVHDNIFGDGIASADPWVFKTALQFEGEQRYVIVSNNTFRKGLTLPLYFCDTEDSQNCQDIQICNNTFENVTYGYLGHNGMFAPAIDFGSNGRYETVRNISILHNTFTANRELGGDNISSCAMFLPTAKDYGNIYIKNNIFTGFAVAAIIARGSVADGTLDNLVLAKNLYYNNGNNDSLKTIMFKPGNVKDDKGIIANPRFISQNDFHLQASSPAIWAGENVGLASDKDGVAWHNPASIGAFEFIENGNHAPSIQKQVFTVNVTQNLKQQPLTIKPALDGDQMSPKTIIMDHLPASPSSAVQLKDLANQTTLGIHMYPNPVEDGLLIIKIDDGLLKQFELSILDASGKMMLQKRYEQVNSFILNVSAYPPALYLIQIRSTNFLFSDKFTIK